MADVAVAGGSKGMEFIENPFVVNGVLSQKADYIITHSTITRREILIADPDCIPQPVEPPQNTVAQQEPPEDISSREEEPTNPDHEEDVVIVTVAPSMERPPVAAENNVTSSQQPRPSVAKPETVEAEVKKVDAAEPQHAEEVRLKKKRCCSVL